MRARILGFVFGALIPAFVFAQDAATSGNNGSLTEQQRSDIDAMLQNDRKLRCERLAALDSSVSLSPQALAIMCPESVASAQKDKPATPAGSLAAKGQHAFFVRDLPNTTLDDPVDRGGARFEVSTTNDSGRAGVRLSSQPFDCQGAPQRDSRSACSLSMTASAPVSKSGSDTSIATLSGFANASTLAIDFTRFTLTGAVTPSKDQLVAFVRDAGLERLVLNEKDGEPDVDLDQLYVALEKAGRSDLSGQATALFFKPDSMRWNWGANATIGYESDDYFSPTTLSAANKKSEPWSVGLYGGFFAGPKFYVSGAFDLAHSYKAAKTRTLCPTGSGGVIECVTGSFGPPKETEKHLASLNARTEIADVGVALKLTHDVKSGDSGADLPIYLFSDSKHALNGGLRLGWTNTDHFTAGVFVGSTFDIYGN